MARKHKVKDTSVFAPFDFVDMDRRLNTNAVQQVGNRLLKRERRRS